MTPADLEQRARVLARTVAQRYGDVASLARFPTGLCHYVYDVALADGSGLVVRVASPDNRHLLRGAVAWSARLRPLGVPLPDLLAHDVDGPLPYLVLERLPGADLGLVHATLSPEQRGALAAEVVGVQRAVGTLGVEAGYGYSHDPLRPPPRPSWTEVVLDNLRRSGGRLSGAPRRVRELHEAVTRRVAGEDRLAAVPAVPFLDDLTTKNVLVHEGRLSGVVDVDVVCFGDPLSTPALTKVALVAAGAPTDYVDAWLELLAPDRAGVRAFDLYCAVFCLDLLGEAGTTFNRDEPVVLDGGRADRLLAFAARCAP